MVLALVVWGLLVPALLFVRRSPESIGLLPDGEVPRTARAREPAAAPLPREAEWTLAEALRARAFWLLIVAVASHSLISTALTFHHVSFMNSLGIDSAAAATVFTVIAPASLAGTFLAGVLVDRIAGRYLLAVAQAGLTGAMLWAISIAQPWQAFVYGGILGFTSGFGATLQSVIWPNYFGRRHVGSIRSAAAIGMMASAAIGPLPFGWLSDLTGSYRTTTLAFLIFPLVSALAGLAARPPHK
jgi:cyanate permease